MSYDPSDLDLCGCCEGVEALTPASVENLPGLSALAYRVGTHGSFKETMLAALSRQAALRPLTTRADDDPSVALLDAWATVLDVLSFYQERIADEGYLRTADERRSILELARSIGYELGPGVAASTYLAFTLETAPGAPTEATIAAGTKAQSLPGQDERPQTFETVETIEARAAWTAMMPRRSEPAVPGLDDTVLYLAGTATNLRKGDALLLVGDERRQSAGSERWDLRHVAAVAPDADAGVTTVTLDRGLGSHDPFTAPAADPTVYALRTRAALFGHNAPDWRSMPYTFRASYLNLPSTTEPSLDDYPDWPDFTLTDIADGEADTVYLDAAYPEIVPGSWVVLAHSGWVEAYEVEASVEDARARFAVSAKSARLTLTGEHLDRFDDEVRRTVVYGQSELLPRADRPITADVGGRVVDLSTAVDGLAEGQHVMVLGTDAATGEKASEVAVIESVALVSGVTRLTFTDDLAHTYLRDAVTFNANVAAATHGETQAGEVLGSGDGSKAFQRFTLRKKPLTYTAAATPSGGESTLEVRVDGVLWDEVPTLYDVAPDRRVYTTRLADDGTVTVQFGDGIHGARLPTGTENVTATYRVGTGLDGLVDARQISLLATRPLGVKSVLNPEAPAGAADPEVLDEARRNAPLTVLTLDRIVSLQDFEDFAHAFAGIAKARAALLWDGEHQLVHLTVAGAAGASVGSDLHDDLVDAIDAARHPDQRVVVGSYDGRPFPLTANVLVDARYLADDVFAGVEAALVDAFSFDARAFGQAVAASEVVAVMQAVEGVVAVDLDALDGLDPFLHPRLPAHTARWEGGTLRPAELLTVDPDGIVLNEMTP